MDTTPTSIGRRRDELARDRRRFVHATVVRVEQPTSARPGDQAIIHDDGSLEGFVGGQCTETSVKVAALGALRDGRSVLLRVLPEDAGSFPDAAGATVVVNPCLSGGAIEIFLDPVLPAPILHVAGESPIARAVAQLASQLDYEVTLAAEGATVDGASAVVIARHGGPEANEVRAALDGGASYVGLVASTRRGSAVLDEAGLSDAERPKVSSPAGHDIGARTPGEIAVSILAEVIEALSVSAAAEEDASASTEEVYTIGRTPAPQPDLATDPVCGMSVVVAPDAITLEVEGETFYFCRSGCRETYAAQRGVAVPG